MRMIVATLCVLGVAALALPATEEPKPEWDMVAPDGVPYDNEESCLLMQKEARTANLLGNGSFEKGRYWPLGWQATDGLTTFWIDGGTDGKRCMRIYTDVLEAQWYARQDEVRAAVDAAGKKTGGNPQSLPQSPIPPAPERIPTQPPYYDTVAGIHGVHYRSEYVKVQPRAIYRFSIDARTDGTSAPRVFIKGFFDQKMKTAKGIETVRRDAYRAPMILDPCDKHWRRYAREFHPWKTKSTLAGKPLRPEWLQVQIYAYWRPGNYYFDNVRLDVIGMEEPDPASNARPEPGKVPAHKEEARPELDDDGFPIFDH